MSVEKFSVSFDPDLGRAIRAAAHDDGESVSAWMAEAARSRLRTMALGSALDETLRELGLSDHEVLDAALAARGRAVRVGPSAPVGGKQSTQRRRAPASSSSGVRRSGKAS